MSKTGKKVAPNLALSQESATRRALKLPEILVHIISYTLTRPGVDKGMDAKYILKAETRITVQDTPWPFALVCKTWHEIIFSSPVLWSAFFALITRGRFDGISRLSSMLDVCLRHSKSVPLTIWISLEFNFYWSSDTEPLLIVSDLIDQAKLHQNRWQDIRIRYTSFPFTGLTQEPYPIHLTVDLKETPIIRRLDIEVETQNAAYLIERNVLTLAQCESLETLRLHGNMEVAIPSAMANYPSIYFPKLRSLDVASNMPVLSQCWFLLRSSPNVERLTLNFKCPKDTPVHVLLLSSLSLSKLRTLTINATHLNLPLQLFGHLEAPSLENLRLKQISFDNKSLVEMGKLMSRLRLGSLRLSFAKFSEGISDFSLETFFCSLGELTQLDISSSISGGIPEHAFRVLSDLISGSLPGGDIRTTILPDRPDIEEINLPVNHADIRVVDGESNVVKNLVIACRKRKRQPSEFHLLLRLEDTSEAFEHQVRETAIESFLEDMEIRQCVSDNFHVTVDFRSVKPILGKEEQLKNNKKKKLLQRYKLARKSRSRLK
ncbi:hypothetical protein SCHPADRAFT_48380 [Schizopora paradoxa]|uniref:F-box domain-containing protein n=1 Tax=Schizopora paradoxa TaxID=27342 RepID=A0A0H2S6R0_9AGAM|nr:hypothetical protein SCHPADRAFT_48380 [Schizopora paradoxa]